MTAQATTDALIEDLQRAVDETLAFFSGPAQSSRTRIDRWGAWDVLAHLPYWHYATTWGIASANRGGPPWQVSGSADEVNDAALALHAGESFDDVVRTLRVLQDRLLRVASAAPNLDAAAFRMPDGRTVSVRQRLETIARHWRGHVQALKEAGG